jgi:serine/threonine protein kinase, bacterial
MILISVNTAGRTAGVGLESNVTVTQFVALPDDDSYPSAVTVASDGTVYTGSYATGAVWKITSGGEISEIAGTRDSIGSVVGLTTAPDGTLYILDRENSDPRTSGGKIWRLQSTLETFATISDVTGFVSPTDITLDAQGNVYVADRGRKEVWRFNPDGTNGVPWWFVGENEVGTLPTGLAFDAANNAILITDSELNRVYRVGVDSGYPGEIIYSFSSVVNHPGFDGLTVAPDGQIYIAALSQNGIVRFKEGEISYIAGTFRGSSDVAAAPDGRLYVANFDSAALVLPGVQPQLPFGIDVITFGE